MCQKNYINKENAEMLYFIAWSDLNGMIAFHFDGFLYFLIKNVDLPLTHLHNSRNKQDSNIKFLMRT